MLNLLDDILMHGKTKEEHDRRLEKVCIRLEEKGLIIGMGYCPKESNITVTEKYEKPRNPEEVS